MTITELLPQLSPSAQAEIEKVLGKDEWPQAGDKYWVIDNAGDIFDTSWDDDQTDVFRESTGNIFRTEAEAEECTRTGWHAKLVAQTTINRFCEAKGIENKFVAGVENWCPYYDTNNDGEMKLSYFRNDHYSTIFNVRHKDDAIKIITACGNEIKILLNVGGE